MSDLQIKRIDVFQVDLPYSGGVYRLSRGREYTSFDATIVRITTQNGIEGWGESTPFCSRFVAAHALGVRSGIVENAPKLTGLDPQRVDCINEVMDATLVGHEHAKAALDIARWDIFGKFVGLPVCEFLGGRTELALPITSSIHIGELEEMRSRVAKHREMGYTGHSVKINGDPVSDAARIQAALADQQPGAFFIVDANCGLTVETALRMLSLLPKGVDFILEAPCAPIGNASLFIAGQASVIHLIADDAVEGIGMKITKNGGLTKSRRIREICLAAEYTFSVQDTVGSDIAFAAIVHLGQTFPEKYLRYILENRDMVTLKTADGPFHVEGGRITAPNVPGLGVQPRLEVLGQPVASYY